MRTPLRIAAVLAAVLVATSGCASSGDDATPSSPAAPGPSVSVPSVTASAGPSGAPATLPADLRTRPAVAAAIDDAAKRAKVPPGKIVIAAWSPVTFDDGSLGCPQKGMSYTQAQVAGELLLLRTDSQLFQYTSPADGEFGYCADPSAGYTVHG